MKKYLLPIILILIISFTQIVFADSSLIVYSSTSDGDIWNEGVSWSSIRESVEGEFRDTSAAVMVGAEYYAPDYAICKSCFYFDTSPIPSNAIIDSVTLNLYGYYDDSTLDFNVVMQNGQPIYPHEPLESGDYNMVHYSGNGGSFNTSDFLEEAGYNVITLNETGRGWIQKGDGAVTKFCLRSSKDIDNIVPDDASSVYFYTSDETGTDKDPKLVINYHIPKWNTKIISKWNTKEFIKWNGLE